MILACQIQVSKKRNLVCVKFVNNFKKILGKSYSHRGDKIYRKIISTGFVQNIKSDFSRI